MINAVTFFLLAAIAAVIAGAINIIWLVPIIGIAVVIITYISLHDL